MQRKERLETMMNTFAQKLQPSIPKDNPGVDTRFALYPLTQDEMHTCEAIVASEGTQITVMPTHHINDLGNFCGFRYKCHSYANANQMPISRNMFHGTTMVQCDVSEDQILSLMMTSQQNRDVMKEFLQEVSDQCIPATLDCSPINDGTLTTEGAVHAMGMSNVDSQNWTPEVPDRIGIYHAYIKGFNRDVRTHRLFLVCSGGLQKASDEFCNLIIDVGKHWTCHDVMMSQEAYWLRKACQRARCRLLKMLADKFSIPVSHIQDMQDFGNSSMAVYTTDTVEHDISLFDNKTIAIYNGCIDTTKNMNGMLCNMHPAEGVWLFRGAHRASCYGSMYGDYSVSGVFPVTCPVINRPQSVLVQDAASVVRLHSKIANRTPYMCFDENYFKILEHMQWNRDNSYEALIPIIVGMN